MTSRRRGMKLIMENQLESRWKQVLLGFIVASDLTALNHKP